MYNEANHERRFGMSIVLQFDPRANVTYAYHNEITWDKESKRSKSKRTLIGKLDTESGEIIPSSGKRRRNQIDEEIIRKEIEEYNQKVFKDKHMGQISDSQQQEQIRSLQIQYRELASQIDKIYDLLTSLAHDITEMNS